MQAVSQGEIIALVADLNSFADSAENMIGAAQEAHAEEQEKLKRTQSAQLASLDADCKAKCELVRQKSQNAIRDAKRILTDVTKLDRQLSSIDKYYSKTKVRKEAMLAGTTDESYSSATNYFDTLAEIQRNYNVLFRKYSEYILPGLLNGLNFIFSSQRRQDYEDLIILRNTVAAFVTEMERELPPIITENTAAIRRQTTVQRTALLERHRKELAALEDRYHAQLDEVAGKICSNLDEILPDEFVAYLQEFTQRYISSAFKVNGSGTVQDGILDICFLDYPVNYFVESKIVASVIQDKCAGLLTDQGVIRLPVAMSTTDAPVWMIAGDGSSSSAVQSFTHALMFGFLSALPVSRLTYSVVDPENRGNSVFPFFDAKKKLPELFGEKIYINSEDISVKIAKLNEKIETTLQERLGTQYQTVFDYERENPDYTAQAELLLLYDFPKGFDERTLAELRNILRNGARCGIYVIISRSTEHEGTQSEEFIRNLTSVQELTTTVTQSGRSFLLHGLPLVCFSMPDKAEFDKFFSKYMLIFEGLKNRGIAFPPLIKKLVETRDSVDLEAHIAHICEIMRNYERDYARVPDVRAPFPSSITLGNVLYPADIFSDSVGYQQILDKFGVENAQADQTGYVELPLTFDLKNSFNLFLNCPEAAKAEMTAFTHHVIWSFLSFMPVTKANICVFDAEQRGNSILPFLDFRKRCPETFDQKIYTNSDAMLERLQSLNAQIDQFIQEKLGNRYKDILDYNLNTPSRAEAVTLLVLYDFPSGMDGRSLDMLANILRNGNKCGIFTILCYNPEITYSRYDSIDERLERLQQHCVMVDRKNGRYCLLPYNLPVNLPHGLSSTATDEFIEDYARKSEQLKKQGLSFRDIISRNLFSRDSSESLRIPVGVGDGDAVVDLVIGEGSSHHGLIAGATGSGKSTLLHALIMSGMLHYGPDQLNLYLMDFKSGTEFKVYESVKLPHIKLLALDAMQEFGESILENLVSEMERRGALFKEAGQTSLRGYIRASGLPLPRILVIMDEFQILFNDSSNRKVAMNCAELAKRIVTEGRAFGIHLLMATQSTKVITDLSLSRGTIEQMRIRIGLKCGEDDARYLFSDEHNQRALAMMKGPIGTAVMNLDYTEQENIGFRAAFCDKDTMREYLETISNAFPDYPCTLQVFEGSRTVRLLDYFTRNGIGLTRETPAVIHMGELIKVAPPFAIRVDRKRKHNLLICGSNEKMASTISGNYMISALLNENASVYCIDGDQLVGDETALEFYNALLCAGDRFKVAYTRGDIIRFIGEIYDKYTQWKKQGGNQTVFVVIRNLQFLDIVKAMLKGDIIDESEYADDIPAQEPEEASADPFAAINSMFANRASGGNLNTGEKLLKLVGDGSGFGIHFVVTCLEYQTVRETMHYGENVLSRFPERIVFSLGDSDAENLIENVAVAGLRENTVYFTDSVKNLFQLKPYTAPSPAELKRFLSEVFPARQASQEGAVEP